MSEPLPALRGLTEPENGSPVRVLRERRADGDADVEAPACATQVAVSPPAHVPIHLILGIEPLALHQAFAQAKRHAGVVGPLAGLQVKRAAPNHVRKRFERAGRLEFQCAAEREPEQRAVVAVPQSPAVLPVLVVEPTILQYRSRTWPPPSFPAHLETRGVKPYSCLLMSGNVQEGPYLRSVKFSLDRNRNAWISGDFCY